MQKRWWVVKGEQIERLSQNHDKGVTYMPWYLIISLCAQDSWMQIKKKDES